jgi:hypothetical protein
MDTRKLAATLSIVISVGSLAAIDPAQAEVVTWINRGVIEEVATQLPPAFAGVEVGDEFELRVTFDNAAALWATLPFPPGSLHVYDYSSVAMTLTVGAVGPINFTPLSPGSSNPYYGNVLYARDDSGDIVADDYPPVMDGYSFGAEYAPGEGIALVFRGDVLDLVNGTQLPTTPDRRLTDLRDAFLAVRRFDATGVDPLFVESHFLGRVRSVEASPGTAPVVTPNVTGTLGNNGWYVGDVQLDWTVSDRESAVASSTGCDTVHVVSDTAGVPYTCTARSAGGTGSATATIRRDATPPLASATASPRPNADGWNSQSVTVSFDGTDALSGLEVCDPDVVLATSGANQSASGRCYDIAGNQSALVTADGINIDKSRPGISIRTPSNKATYRQGQAITLDYVCSDLLSGVRSCLPLDTNLRSGDSMNLTRRGKFRFTVEAVDNVGNKARESVTYTVTP